MINLNFYIKPDKVDKNNLVPVYAQVSYEYKKFRRTLFKVKKKHWNSKKQRMKPNRQDEPYNDYVYYNEFLDSYYKNARKYFNDCEVNGTPITDTLIKNYLNGNINELNKEDFFQTFKKFIDFSKPDKAISTIKGYNSTYKFLEDFEKEEKYALSFESLNFDFFDRFKRYAFQRRNVNDNYFSKLIAVLKTFMSWAKDRGYHNNEVYKKFKAREKEKEVIYLKIDELLHLYNKEFDSAKMRKTRDLFCFLCFTGMRYSDAKQLTVYNWVEKNRIRFESQKTKTFHTVPLNDFAIEIIKRYRKQENGEEREELLPFISNQKLNNQLKDCLKEAKLNRVITMKRYSGSNVETVSEPLHKLVTTHVGRKTYITNSIYLGMHPKVVKENVGQKKDATMNKYLKIAEDLKEKETEKTWNNIRNK